MIENLARDAGGGDREAFEALYKAMERSGDWQPIGRLPEDLKRESFRRYNEAYCVAGQAWRFAIDSDLRLRSAFGISCPVPGVWGISEVWSYRLTFPDSVTAAAYIHFATRAVSAALGQPWASPVLTSRVLHYLRTLGEGEVPSARLQSAALEDMGVLTGDPTLYNYAVSPRASGLRQAIIDAVYLQSGILGIEAPTPAADTAVTTYTFAETVGNVEAEQEYQAGHCRKLIFAADREAEGWNP